MDFTINIDAFEKKVDENTGSILFFKRKYKGIPDKVISRNGYTIEFKGKEIVMIDIYNPSVLISFLTKDVAESIV